MMKKILLVEIGTEELPPKMLCKFGELFAKNVEFEFKTINITYKKVIWFASSRRLAVKIIDIAFGVYIDVSYVNKRLFMTEFNKDDDFHDKYFLCKRNITLLISGIFSYVLMKLPVAMMKWGKENIKFIRPVRTVSVLLDDEVVLCNFFGINSSRIIRGHRFMGDKEIILDHAKNYQEVLLKKGFVIVDYKRRKDVICSGIENFAKQVDGVVDYSGNLLEEVTGLSEWPVVLFGTFDKRFLDLPKEILLYIMKCQKKYFPLYSLEHNLLPYFIFVIDIVTENNNQIITDHEKVLHLSFSDVEFFLNCDKKYLLEEYLSRLHTVLFHTKLGSLYDKSMRIRTLSSRIASKIGVDVGQTERAAMLSKCDLLSNMVFEFPFSQGIIGMYYAIRDGETEEVAIAQKEQYYPRYSSDRLPNGSISCVISIVDKVDTITGMFMIGEYPKGNRDPMGLRRAAIGVLRIIIEKKIAVDLWSLVENTLNLYESSSVNELVKKIIHFMYKRLCVLYEKKGYKIDIILATLSNTLSNLVDFDRRISAVSSFCLLEESRLLFFMYKRILNILGDSSELSKYEINAELLLKKEEIKLAEKISIFQQELMLLCEVERYYDALNLLLTLHAPLDSFFKNVIVMSNDKDLRLNRLILLNKTFALLLIIINTPNYIFNILPCIK